MISVLRGKRRVLPGVALLATALFASMAAGPVVSSAAADTSLPMGGTHSAMGSWFDGIGAPSGGCGVPDAGLESQDYVALNVFNTPGSYTKDPAPRPMTAAQAGITGTFDNGHNCGRYVQVKVGDICTGINDGAPGQQFCRGGNWTRDKFNDATLTMLVADSCGDDNAWCRDDTYHLDLHKSALNNFQLNGAPVSGLVNSWNNRQISWSFVPAPAYTGDIKIGWHKDAQPAYYAAAVVSHLPNGIHGVEYFNGTTWTQAHMEGDNGQEYILAPSSQGGTSYTIRVTDADGKLVQGGRTYTFGYPSSCGSQCAADYTPVSYTTGGGGTGGGDTTAPTTPGAPAVTATTSSSVSLSWAASTDNVAVTTYTVFRNGQQVGTTAGTGYTDTALAPATAYQYTVTASDAAGNRSASSAARSATTAPSGSSSGPGPVLSGIPGKCLDDPQNSTAAGVVVTLYSCNGSAAQNWAFAADGTVRINGLCLDVTGGSTLNGTPVELWTCHGGPNQQWARTGGQLVSAQSGKCLDDPNVSTTDGTRLDIWGCDGGINQKWTPQSR